MDDYPALQLVELDRPAPGNISAHLEGEPDVTHVQDVADAIMCALSRGVDLLVPRHIFDAIRDDFPPELPAYIRVE